MEFVCLLHENAFKNIPDVVAVPFLLYMFAGKSSAEDLAERLHVGLVRLLVGEAYDATSTYLMSILSLPLNK